MTLVNGALCNILIGWTHRLLTVHCLTFSVYFGCIWTQCNTLSTYST